MRGVFVDVECIIFVREICGINIIVVFNVINVGILILVGIGEVMVYVGFIIFFSII